MEPLSVTGADAYKAEGENKIYRKHQSFDVFISNLGTDVLFQRKRALAVLMREAPSMKGGRRTIIDHVIENLKLNDENLADFKITVPIADELSQLNDDQIIRYIIHRYRYDIFPKNKILDDYPPYLQIEPSSVCNFRCVFCYQTDADFTKKSSGFMGSMDVGRFKDIIDQCVGHIEFFSLASRGEPFTCKDIDQMLEYCAGKFLGLKVNTNASLLTEKHCHALLAGGVNTVVFSADAAEEPHYSRLRVNGSLEKTLRNIKMFRSIKEKHYSSSHVITRVSGVKFEETQNMPSMQKTWGSLVDQICFVAYNPWENVYESPVNSVTAPCSDLWRRMFIWYDGKVNPCDTDYKSTLAVGDLREKSISQIWQSKQYEQLRSAHLKAERSKINPCRRCVVI